MTAFGFGGVGDPKGIGVILHVVGFCILDTLAVKTEIFVITMPQPNLIVDFSFVSRATCRILSYPPSYSRQMKWQHLPPTRRYAMPPKHTNDQKSLLRNMPVPQPIAQERQ
jgi:hypothetical protein